MKATIDEAIAAEAKERLTQTADQLFFIVGCARSGTTLLQNMITAHPHITMPNETGFYTLIRKRYLRRWGELQDPAKFAAAIEATLRFWRIQSLDIDADEVRALCRANAQSWETILLAILTALAAQHGALRVGEKSPGHVHYLGLLQERFPRAKFIHVVRDPRAVVLSQMNAPFGSKYIKPLCRRWQAAIRAHKTYMNALGPERYHLVRYEDLVRKPETELRSVCNFLGSPFASEMLEPWKRKGLVVCQSRNDGRHCERNEAISDEERGVRLPRRSLLAITHQKKADRPLGFDSRQRGHMENTLKPIFTSSIDKWKLELSSEQIALIEYGLSEDMRAMNYGSHQISGITKLPLLP